MTPSRPLLAAVLALCALPIAACGDGDEPISGSDAPAVTSPGTTIPYAEGGGDGSGADGSTEPSPRGGTAAGRDAGTR